MDCSTTIERWQEVATASLPKLAEQINHAHRQCEAAMNAGLQHALKAGRLLWEAKGHVGHGGWLPWVVENCPFSKRTAQAYMRVARQYPRLDGKAQRVARLTLRGAVAAVASNSQTLANVPEDTQTEALNLWDEKRCNNSHQAIHQAEMARRTRAFEEEMAAKRASRAQTPVAKGGSLAPREAACRDEEREPWTDDPVGQLLDGFIGSAQDLLKQINEATGGVPQEHPTHPFFQQIGDALFELAAWLDHELFHDDNTAEDHTA